jgi:ABC-type Fe3+ transport system permease subunit
MRSYLVFIESLADFGNPLLLGGNTWIGSLDGELFSRFVACGAAGSGPRIRVLAQGSCFCFRSRCLFFSATTSRPVGASSRHPDKGVGGLRLTPAAIWFRATAMLLACRLGRAGGRRSIY